MEATNINLYNLLKNDLNLTDAKALEFVRAIKNEVANDIKFYNNAF